MGTKKQFETIEEALFQEHFKPVKKNSKNARFLMMSEILCTLNKHSTVKLSAKRLNEAMVKFGAKEPISMRLPYVKEVRYVYPVKIIVKT
jgi:hypothetical protein